MISNDKKQQVLARISEIENRHVIGVMKEFLKVDVSFDRYNEFAKFIGLDPTRYLDCILFEYRKLKNISAQACAEVLPNSE